MADGKAHLALEGLEVEPDEIGKAPLQHEVGDAACELHRLVGVAPEADGQDSRLLRCFHTASVGSGYCVGTRKRTFTAIADERDPVAARRLCWRQIRNDPESAYVPDPGKKHLIRV